MAHRGRRVVAATCLVLSCSGCAGLFQSHDGLEATTRAFAAAWQAADAHAVAALFTADATLVVPDGLLLEGRPAIEAFYRSAFAGGYAGSRVDSRLEQAHRFRRDLAMIDGEWRITRSPSAPDERGLFSAVLLHAGNKWAIAALREQTSATAIRRSGE